LAQFDVSVIIPCYNHGQFLPDALESVRTQSAPPAEVIVVNDGSTDPATLRVLTGLRGPELTVIHTPNRGPAAARNAGITIARGKYILPLDADDRISPNFLEKTVEVLDQNPAVGIVYPRTEFFGEKTGHFEILPYEFPAILLDNRIVNSSLYRKVDWEAAGGYDEEMVIGWEDYEFWLSIIGLGRDVVHAAEAVLHYRQSSGSRNVGMLAHDAAIACYAKIFRNHLPLYADHIETVFRELVETRANIAKTHQKAVALDEKLQALDTRHQETLRGLAQSKIWQFRKVCLNIGRKLGINIPQDPW